MAKVKKEKTYTLMGGEVVTERDVDAIAEEFEQGIELPKVLHTYIGRPSLNGQGESPRLTFRAPKKLFDAAQERAEEEGRSVSDVAREALEKFLAS